MMSIPEQSDSNPSGSLGSPPKLEAKENITSDKLNEVSISENSCPNVQEKLGSGSIEGIHSISKFRDSPIPPHPPQPMKRMKVDPKSRSEIWFHFTRLESDNNRAACNYCGAEYAARSKTCGTSSLWSHFSERCKKNPYKLVAGQKDLANFSTGRESIVGLMTLEKCRIKKGSMAGQTTLDKFMVEKEPPV